MQLPFQSIHDRHAENDYPKGVFTTLKRQRSSEKRANFTDSGSICCLWPVLHSELFGLGGVQGTGTSHSVQNHRLIIVLCPCFFLNFQCISGQMEHWDKHIKLIIQNDKSEFSCKYSSSYCGNSIKGCDKQHLYGICTREIMGECIGHAPIYPM